MQIIELLYLDAASQDHFHINHIVIHGQRGQKHMQVSAQLAK